MSAIATYPGTVSPLRGLSPFAESEREVFFGRDADTDALARLVIGDGFRAGLLHGEPGVGKTSLLRAGLVPHLRDHGVVAVLCSDSRRPIESLVHELSAVTGAMPGPEEHPMAFLSRAVDSAVSGQLFLFILDDVDEALAGDDSTIQELGNLYARVVTRSGGRARFLFCCPSESVHRFGALEQRTGSLFPPSSRYELARLSRADATMVLERTLALAGVAADAQIAHAVVEVLAQSGAILPADLQIAALGIIQLGLTSPDALQRMGGAAELERVWLKAGAAATGNERTALRLLAELASDTRKLTAYVAEWAAARASVEPAFAVHALTVLEERGIVRAVQAESGTHYRLGHSILIPRVREIAAPARETSRRAFELLGSKMESGKRLSLGEYRALRREGISPSTVQERDLVERSRRFFFILGGSVLAAPLVVLVVIYIAMIGRVYLDVYTPDQGGAERVVVRAGRPGLSAFHWLPARQPLGSVVADTGFTRAMIHDDAWARVKQRALTGSADDYAAAALDTLDPDYRHVLAYATGGDARALDELRKRVEGPEDLVALLERLRPIARGDSHEVSLVESALKDTSPAVQRSALRVAAATARRRDGVYHDTLAQALTSSDAELRRLAFSAAHALGEDTARTLYRAALAANPEPGARRELLAMVTAADAAQSPSAASASSILVNRDIPASTRERARSLLKRAFTSEPAAAARAAARLAGDDKAPQEDRIFALTLMRSMAPEDTYAEIAADIKATLGSADEPVRAAALPLYARVAPQDAAGELALLLERQPLGDELRRAMALAWGEVARSTRDRAAAVALETLIKDSSLEVRAAAAEAYGNVGRVAQNELIKMIKTERLEVAVGAARGLANTAAAGASPSVAVGGIAQMWKRKGRARREAAEVFAHMATERPGAVYSYIAAAARSTEDAGLHPIGVRGLCNAGRGGHRNARRALARAAEGSSVEVRRVVIECIADSPGDARTAIAIATRLAREADVGIRSEAARVLASMATDSNEAKAVAEPLAALALDDDREVRILAIRALARMGDAVPQETGKALIRAFDRADESEKLVLIEAARDMNAGELLQQAITDPSPLVRTAALDAALSVRATNLGLIMNAALTDRDRNVRSAALERLAASQERLEQGALSKSLSLAVRDPDPLIAQLALTTLARLGSSDDVARRLGRMLRLKSEHERVQAASACAGLVDRHPEIVIQLLTPLLDDASHDVRAAMLPALAAAWNATHTPEQLAAMLEGAEKHAMRRVTATAAFLALARTEAGREAALTSLAKVAERGPQLARIHAALGIGLIESAASGIEFLQIMAP